MMGTLFPTKFSFCFLVCSHFSIKLKKTSPAQGAVHTKKKCEMGKAVKAMTGNLVRKFGAKEKKKKGKRPLEKMEALQKGNSQPALQKGKALQKEQP